MALSKFHLLSLSILHTKPVSRKATTFANRSFADRDLRCSISLRRTFNTIAGYRGDPISTALGTRRTGMLTTIVASGCSIYNFATSASAGRDGAATSKEEVFVKSTITSHDIVIFSKSYCPYCQAAKQLFFDLDKEPYVVELDERDDGADIQETLAELVGKQTVPQVFVKGKHVGGSDDTLEAYESGALTELLGSNPT